MMTDKVGIYIHVPFCLSKCYYCDFCSISRAGDEEKERYVDRLCAEIRLVGERIRDKFGKTPMADTVYFGGGTPSLLTPEQIGRLLLCVSDNFGIAHDSEITLETNPKSVDRQKLCELRGAGVNRLSIGMQSVHDAELRALGRIHGYRDFSDTYNDARAAGFDNVSVDLMYGIPNQTRESFCESVKSLASLSPDHISSYSLTIEENTVFHRRRNELILPDEDTVADMYSDMARILEDHGYKKYEISNFAHKGRESKHNLKYWNYDAYLGFGAAAHSFFDGVRYSHSDDISAYMDGKPIYESVQRLSEKEQMNEYVMLAMRLVRGVDKLEFKKRFGRDFDTGFGQKFSRYVPGYVQMDSDNCSFCDSGMFISNYILADVLEFGE